MKSGDQVQVRYRGLGEWVIATVDLASRNGRSIAVSADTGLATGLGYAVNAATGKMQLLLLKFGGGQYYQNLQTGEWWEVQDALPAG